ncbi:MAG TPA: hypothetical protein VFX55_16275 [Duganella sp.]|nr:hypothetical protein [Duganella sp.]
MAQQSDTASKLPPHMPDLGHIPPEVIARLLQRKGLLAGFGIFKGKDVFPDGLAYQLQVRAEWD